MQNVRINLIKFNIALIQAGITKKQLAERMGMSYISLYNRLTGRVPWTRENLKIIEHNLGVSWGELVD